MFNAGTARGAKGGKVIAVIFMYEKSRPVFRLEKNWPACDLYSISGFWHLWTSTVNAVLKLRVKMPQNPHEYWENWGDIYFVTPTCVMVAKLIPGGNWYSGLEYNRFPSCIFGKKSNLGYPIFGFQILHPVHITVDLFRISWHHKFNFDSASGSTVLKCESRCGLFKQ